VALFAFTIIKTRLLYSHKFNLGFKKTPITLYFKTDVVDEKLFKRIIKRLFYKRQFFYHKNLKFGRSIISFNEYFGLYLNMMGFKQVKKQYM